MSCKLTRVPVSLELEYEWIGLKKKPIEALLRKKNVFFILKIKLRNKNIILFVLILNRIFFVNLLI